MLFTSWQLKPSDHVPLTTELSLRGLFLSHHLVLNLETRVFKILKRSAGYEILKPALLAPTNHTRVKVSHMAVFLHLLVRNENELKLLPDYLHCAAAM